MLEIRCRFWRTRSTLTGRSDGRFPEALCLLDAGDGRFASCTCHFFAKKGNYSVCRCGCLLGDKGMCGRRLFFDLHFLHGGEHVLNVVVFFHSLEEFFYCCATFGIKFLGGGWGVHELGAGEFEVVGFEMRVNRLRGLRGSHLL